MLLLKQKMKIQPKCHVKEPQALNNTLNKLWIWFHLKYCNVTLVFIKPYRS